MLKRFTANMGRGPGTPGEWMEVQNAAVRHINKTKGVPKRKTEDPFKGWKPEVVETEVKIDDLLKGPVKSEGPKGERTWDFSKKAEIIPLKMTADEHIKFIKSKSPIEAMKEANSVIGRKGRYKNITHEDADRILKDVDDHIFQRNIEYDEFGEPIKPDEFAQGGRIGYGAGDFVKKITKRFSKDRRKEDITKWLKEKDVDLTAEEWSSKPFKEKLKLWGWKFQPFYTGELEKGKDYAQGGIAPLIGEPSYAANFYDDRTPMKRGKKAKKKKKRVGSIEDVWGGLSPEEKKKFRRMFPPWARLPHGEQRYKKKSDLPEGILELLEKDPGFDFENFKDTYWAGEGWRHTDPTGKYGLRGSYSPMMGAIELNMAPFGEKEYTKYPTHSPHLPDRFLTDTDKAKITLHELRHKNILEDRELFMTQPEWVQRQKGPGYLPQGGVTGHELYNRFLDQRYYPPEADPGPSTPYFDKILKDYWDPYAQDYEKTAKRRLSEKRGEGIEVLANQGGRIGYAAGKIVKGGKWFLNMFKIFISFGIFFLVYLI